MNKQIVSQTKLFADPEEVSGSLSSINYADSRLRMECGIYLIVDRFMESFLSNLIKTAPSHDSWGKRNKFYQGYQQCLNYTDIIFSYVCSQQLARFLCWLQYKVNTHSILTILAFYNNSASDRHEPRKIMVVMVY